MKEKKDTLRDKTIALLSGLGVDNPEALLEADSETAGNYGKQLNHVMAMGKKAANKLQEMQDRNPHEEIIKMGCDKKPIYCDSVEDFGKTNPFFVCAEAIVDQNLTLYDGTKIELKKGQEICMSPTHYSRHVANHPVIKPAKKTFLDHYTPYKGQDLTNKTLFIWRYGGIGDLLFIRPILMRFKEKYKGVKIIFATSSKYHSMIEQWTDCVDHLYNHPFYVKETLESSDYHICYEGLIERCSDAEAMDVHDLFAKHSHIELTNYNYPMRCICQNSFFDIFRNKYAVVQIGSSSHIRTPFHGKMIPVVDFLTDRIDVVISGSPREQRTIEDFISCCKYPERITNFAKHTGSVVDAVKLVTDSSLVVAPDSSHVHIAATQGTPCVGIYGPFPAACRTKHYPNCINVEPDESEACTHGGKACFLHSHLPCKWHTKCWHNLDSYKIIKAIKELKCIPNI